MFPPPSQAVRELGRTHGSSTSPSRSAVGLVANPLSSQAWGRRPQALRLPPRTDRLIADSVEPLPAWHYRVRSFASSHLGSRISVAAEAGQTGLTRRCTLTVYALDAEEDFPVSVLRRDGKQVPRRCGRHPGEGRHHTGSVRHRLTPTRTSPLGPKTFWIWFVTWLTGLKEPVPRNNTDREVDGWELVRPFSRCQTPRREKRGLRVTLHYRPVCVWRAYPRQKG